MPSKSDHATAITYGGMSKGITNNSTKDLLKGKLLFPNNIPKGTPNNVEKKDTVTARPRLFRSSIHCLFESSILLKIENVTAP